MRVGPYLFYTEKAITQFETTEKNDWSPQNDDLTLWRGPAAKKKPPFFNARALITREITRSKDAQSMQYWGMTLKTLVHNRSGKSRAPILDSPCKLSQKVGVLRYFSRGE